MDLKRIKWNSLLRYAELEFQPEAPSILEVEDALVQCLSILTGATGGDRRLLRCTEQGALLTSDAWNLLAQAETDELAPANNTPDSFTATVDNKGVLIATSTGIVKISIVRKSGGSTEHIYLPPNWLYWFPFSVYSVTATTVPADAGGTFFVGITTFN